MGSGIMELVPAHNMTVWANLASITGLEQGQSKLGSHHVAHHIFFLLLLLKKQRKEETAGSRKTATIFLYSYSPTHVHIGQVLAISNEKTRGGRNFVKYTHSFAAHLTNLVSPLQTPFVLLYFSHLVSPPDLRTPCTQHTIKT